MTPPAVRRSLLAAALLLTLPALLGAGILSLVTGPPWYTQPAGRVFVLSIGIDHYQSRHVPPLEFATYDAGRFSNSLEMVFNPNVLLYTLTDAQATRANIESEIRHIASLARSQDMFVLLFAGHAFDSGDPQHKHFYLLPFDALYPDSCENTGCIPTAPLINSTLLYSWLTQLHAQRQVILLDSSSSDSFLPAFRDLWTKESCTVGHAAAKRVLIFTNHGDGLEFTSNAHPYERGGYLTGLYLRVLHSFVEQNKPYMTAFQLQQAAYSQAVPDWLRQNLGFLTPDQRDHLLRVDLFGGDFLIAGAHGVPPQNLLLDSGLGPLCYSEDNASRGLQPVAPPPAPAPPPPQPTNYALLLATDHYTQWPELQNPIFDAQTIEKELSQNYGFKTDHLYDYTRDQLRQKLNALHTQRFSDHDQLFIFIAGHGDYDAVDDIGYLVFRDTPAGHAYDSMWSLLDLRNAINTIPAKHIFLVMDTCFAGSLDPELATGSRGVYDPIPLSQLIARSADKETRYFLTSGGREYVPDGNPGRHSPFAALFITALEKSDVPGGYLNLDQLPHYFERLATTPREGNIGKNQDGSDFFFIPVNTASPSAAN